jgi:ABC-2 type transport system permease protein
MSEMTAPANETSDQALLWRAAAAQTRAELTLTMRRGENILITIIVPVILLVFFAALGVPGVEHDATVSFLLPGILALAIIATGMVNLGIATAYERYYGVLKRLGASPLPRGGLLIAKALSVLLLEIVQVVILVAIATFGYDWRPGGSLPLTLLVVILGTLAFAGIGLAMAGGLRAEATLAGANGLYLLFLVFSGAILPLDHLPGPLESLARVLPASALTDALRASFDSTAPFPGSALIVLAAWAIITLALAARTFRWE